MYKQRTILKLQKVFKMGYVPARGMQSYSFINPHTHNYYSLHTNCFEHACFNLTNQLLDEIGVDLADAFSFSLHTDYHEIGYNSTEESLINFIKQTGLEIRPIKMGELIDDFPQFLDGNQWKVALYVCTNDDFKDFHFFLQENDGTWSAKYGFTDKVEKFKCLPRLYISPGVYKDKYVYRNTYVITNPHASKDKSIEGTNENSKTNNIEIEKDI